MYEAARIREARIWPLRAWRIDGNVEADGAKEEKATKKRERLGRQILVFLAQNGPARYERLHEESDPYRSGTIGPLLSDFIEAGWIEREGHDRVKISTLGRRQLQDGDAKRVID